MEQKTEIEVKSNVVLNDNAAAKLSPKAAAVTVIEKLVDEREKWEAAAYRTSNLALYGILQKCYAASKDMQGNHTTAKEFRKGLADFAESKGYTFNEGTPIITKIVKCVFGMASRSRTSTYSLVLREAVKQNIEPADLVKFIDDNGGIQEIRLSKSKNHKSVKDKVDIARTTATSDVLGVATGEELRKLAKADLVDTSCVLIAKQNADGNFEVTAVIRNQSALTAALVGYYSGNQAALTGAAAKKEAANDSGAPTSFIFDLANRK